VECEKTKKWLEKWELKVNKIADNALKYVEQHEAIKYIENNIETYMAKVFFNTKKLKK